MPLDILIGLWIATVAQTVFIVVYGFATPWFGGFIGRALFLKSVVVWVLFASSLLGIYYPTLLPDLATARVLTWLLAFAVVYQCASLLDRRFRDKRGIHEHR